MEKLSQNDQIRLHLEAGNKITPLQAFYWFNCLRLGARIADLKKMGLAIHSRLIESEGKHFAEYSLPSTAGSTASRSPISSGNTPSELNARDRYAVADRIMASIKTKTATISIIAVLLLCSCATQQPGSASLHRAVKFRQAAAQYQSRTPAGKDSGRMYRNQDRRPHKMTKIPFTQFYIF